MNYLIRGFLSALSVRLRSLRSLIVLICLPLLVLVVRLTLPMEEVSAPVQVGVALPESGGHGSGAQQCVYTAESPVRCL